MKNTNHTSLKEVVNLVAEALGCSQESLDTNSGLGKHYKWDSLGQVGIMALLESKYNIKIDATNVERLTTIENIHVYLEEQMD